MSDSLFPTSDFQHPRAADKTLPLTVGNLGFLLDRLGQDCHPLQFLRELTQNSIEAIQRTESRAGQVVWDVDWNQFDLTDNYKLCVIDDGDGMTGPDMVQYINRLSSSLSEQSFMGNYGVGAKIAAATRNPEGLIYLSWQRSRGAMIHLWRDSLTNQYGLRQLERPDGSFGHHAGIEDTIKPEFVEAHGTKVVLQGNDEDSDTMVAPEGTPSPSRWIAKYLNSRYFEFPEGITVRAREGWTNPRADRDRNLLRTLTGQRPYLDSHARASGSISLLGAKAHWWILKDEPAIGNNSGYIESAGHTAALHKSELYEVTSSRAGMARLQQFGVILGYKFVVIYVEPDPSFGKLTTNTARTQLQVDGQPLPWVDWATEFREKMPPEIDSLIHDLAAGSSRHDHSKSIRERLRNILDMYRVSRYRPTPRGNVSIDSEHTTRGGSSRATGASSDSSATARGGRRGGTAGGIYSVFLSPDGEPGEEFRPDPFPAVTWVSVVDGTREPGDNLEDRAAHFIMNQNHLMINADFRVFRDMVEHFKREVDASPAVEELITDAVHGWFEQSLVETVIGVQALQNSQEWTIQEVEKSLSAEALTSAVMPRYHVNSAVRRELGSKIGKLRSD